MNELKIFNNPDFGEVRTLEENGEVLFCGSDVAVALGYAKPRNAIGTHCKGALKRGILTAGGNQEMTFIPEGDVYRLIARSKLPGAEQFERWVFDEVLPSIRKNGGYIAGQEAMTAEELMAKRKRLSFPGNRLRTLSWRPRPIILMSWLTATFSPASARRLKSWVSNRRYSLTSCSTRSICIGARAAS